MSIKGLLVPALATAALLSNSSLTAQTENAAATPDTDAEMVEVTQLIPGFGGMFFDRKGRPNVYLADPTSQYRLKTMNPRVVIHPADFDFSTLQSYRVDLRAALSYEGVVALDVDERSNRVRVSINQDLPAKEKARLRSWILQLSPDPEAVLIDEIAELSRQPSAGFRMGPFPGGTAIVSGGRVCSLGFSVFGGTEFITTSSCTDIPGGVEFTTFSEANSADVIGVEIGDPLYDVTPCPFGRRCRRSDSARVRYTSLPGGFPGTATQVLACSSGTQFDGTLTITSAGTAAVGQTFTMAAASSGCRRGTVLQTCVDVNVSGANITLLCQTIASTNGPPIFPGADIGSPVYIQNGSNATALGLVWGGSSSGGLVVFSPITQVLDELF